MPRDERAIVIARGGLVLSPPEVDAFDAIRTMGLRLVRVDLSTRGAVTFDVREAERGAGWRVWVVVAAGRSAPVDIDAIELGVKSDVGALELAGHSVRLPRPPASVADQVGRLSSPRAEEWIATAGGAEAAFRAIRRAMVSELDARIRHALVTLRENGRDLDIGEGWTPPGPVVFTVPGEPVEDPPRRKHRLGG